MAAANDLTVYERHATDWWNTRSAAFRSLHSVNTFRVALLREWLGTNLRGRVVADLGCGDGLLTRLLALALAWTVYCVVGPLHKEGRYSSYYGARYADHRRRVSYILPGLKP